MELLINTTLSNSLLAAALAVVALAVSRLLKNKPAVAHVLWLLVLVKLVTPPVFSVPVSWPEAHPTAGQVTPADPMQAVGVDISVLKQHLAELRTSQASRSGSLPWPQILVSVWLFGSILWLFRAACRIWRFNQLLKTAELASEDLQTKTLCLAKQLGMRRAPCVLLIDAEVPPMVWCVGWIPRIFLPAALVAGVSARQLELIVTHELAHVKRRDYLIRWFELIVLAVYWWNPIAWLAVRRLRSAEEHCCDAMVVELNSANARSYVETLIQVVDFLAEKRSVPSLASGIGSSPSLKRRCEMILTNNTSSRVGRLACLLILAIGLTVLPFSVQARAQDNSSSDLEKRITRLEKLVDNLRKALNSNVLSNSDDGAVDQLNAEPPTYRDEFKKAFQKYVDQLNVEPLTVPDEFKKAFQKWRSGFKVTELQQKAGQLKTELRSIERQIKELQKSVKDK